jgi:hypothetical protein
MAPRREGPWQSDLEARLKQCKSARGAIASVRMLRCHGLSIPLAILLVVRPTRCRLLQRAALTA